MRVQQKKDCSTRQKRKNIRKKQNRKLRKKNAVASNKEKVAYTEKRGSRGGLAVPRRLDKRSFT